jgi:hypothetical protein
MRLHRCDLLLEPLVAGVDLALCRRPAGPTKGRPFLSSSSPGCSPTSMTLACGSPAPNTVCVAFAHSGQAWQARASSRSCFSDFAIDL